MFVNHHATNCPNDFPNATKYRVLTQTFINAIKQHLKKPLAAVLNNNKSEENVAAVPHPVAIMMGSSNNPIAYMPSNTSNVIKGNSDSDNSMSVVAIAVSITDPLCLVDMLKASDPQKIAPLTVPHLYWWASISRLEFPLTVNTLIDYGSHAV